VPASVVESEGMPDNGRQRILRPTPLLLEEVGCSCMGFLESDDAMHDTTRAQQVRVSADQLASSRRSRPWRSSIAAIRWLDFERSDFGFSAGSG